MKDHKAVNEYNKRGNFREILKLFELNAPFYNEGGLSQLIPLRSSDMRNSSPKKFKYSFLSNTNRHLKSMTEQKGYGLAEVEQDSNSPRTSATKNGRETQRNYQQVFSPKALKDGLDKICYYNLAKKRLFSSQTKRRNPKPKIQKSRKVLKTQAKRRDRAALNEYFAIQSQNRISPEPSSKGDCSQNFFKNGESKDEVEFLKINSKNLEIPKSLNKIDPFTRLKNKVILKKIHNSIYKLSVRDRLSPGKLWEDTGSIVLDSTVSRNDRKAAGLNRIQIQEQQIYNQNSPDTKILIRNYENKKTIPLTLKNTNGKISRNINELYETSPQKPCCKSRRRINTRSHKTRQSELEKFTQSVKLDFKKPRIKLESILGNSETSSTARGRSKNFFFTSNEDIFQHESESKNNHKVTEDTVSQSELMTSPKFKRINGTLKLINEKEPQPNTQKSICEKCYKVYKMFCSQ
ncbi:unnamed protein product [Moneuplotes crassus]|uniref:Uncharacterized protein n=1 Tax=Euplotes crassus TaxID=5936 RepID=A0AAD1XC68_EUPCR|nr:unnamed protein product [Moneuplotes crassus]